jgi:signal transduction histidine kinase
VATNSPRAEKTARGPAVEARAKGAYALDPVSEERQANRPGASPAVLSSAPLRSRRETHALLAVLGSVLAIALGTLLATSLGARLTDAASGAAAGAILATLLVAAAFHLSDSLFFRARAEFKPTIDRLSEDLTTLSSPEEVAQAVERTVRRWLPCDYIRLSLAPRPSRSDIFRDAPGGDAGAADWDGSRGGEESDRGSKTDLRIRVSFAGKPYGLLNVGAKRGGALFTSDEIDLLRTIANHSGLALAHAWAHSELEQRRKQQAEAWRGEREALVETVSAEMAHEIRYPINYFRTLFERSSRSVQLTEDDIDVAREEVDRLERLVSGLKRIAAHRLERAPTSVSDLCVRVEALLSDRLGGRRFDVTLDKDATLRCDPDKLTQVLVNLLSNALDACTRGRIGIVWKRSAQGGELSVWDDGPGFVGEPARLFAPWYTTKPRGTGLGLAITHRLVRTHGWSIVAQRREGRTLFVVSVREDDIMRDGELRESDEARVA